MAAPTSISGSRNPPYASMIFNGTVEDSCVQTIPFCLPWYEWKDIKFQFQVATNPLSFAYYVRISTSCNLPKGDFTPDPDDQANWTLLEQVGNVLLFDGEDAIKVEEGGISAYTDPLACGDCFYIVLIRKQLSDHIGTGYRMLFCSNCFSKICDPCYTTVIQYRCNENAFGFTYFHDDGAGGNDLEDFYNSVRMPFYLQRPQFPSKKNVFTLSNGSKKKLSARIEKEYPGQTDYMPEGMHERLVIALEHDHVLMTNVNVNITDTEVMDEGPYDISWPEFRDYPMGQAKFKVKITPFTNFNTNCKDD